MYLKFRYEYIEVEDVLESEEIGKWNVSFLILKNTEKINRINLQSLNFQFGILIFLL